ncbi:hypothetical protein GCM10009122_34890 [Fulvivirga kasyanovii]|uniref:Carrier domain-containing protein n=1 Tax=Fulvivirga kasyanovii TaxID=396812 RepID=A0ABW9RPM9_9BACT|nr:phosphopantetheine-binding protein [Fulvivirga kasyanovii]MTI25707.1 hypothetical protein [Fulvivirga kasyanovii]
MEQIEQAIHKNLSKLIKREKLKDINDETLIREDLSVDSLKMISLFMSIINELGLEITEFPDADITEFQSIGDLKRMLVKVVEGKSSAS